MAHAIEFENGRPDGPNLCEHCGRPVHPSLECTCGGNTQ